MNRIKVLFENDCCIVLDKPAGLAVQGGKGIENSLDSILAREFSPRPLLVHRLDRDTSGCILAAKGREAAARFSRLFSGERQAVKRYLAVCAGRPEPADGSITLELDVRGTLKASETVYRLLEAGDGFSLLELELGTGRMHQIRRHLARIGCPILGDDKYGDFALNRKLRKTRGLKKLLLHASRLIIPEEAAGFPLDITAPPPDYFLEALGMAGI
ncbi:MAG: RluA family pseudouridine synthase [Treponema sp.]|nr:RluA family pseudouridine synthase [Treponema sp.]